MMRKLFLLIVCVVLASAIANAQVLRFTLASQDPSPVDADNVVKLNLKVENIWDETKDDVKIEIVPEYPFTIYESAPVKDIGRIESRKNYNAVYFDYKLRVDPDAADGDHKISMRVYDQGSKYPNTPSYLLKDQFVVNVKNEKLQLKPYIVSSDLITSEKSGKFTVEIANVGAKDVQSLELELRPSDDYKLLSVSNYVYLGNINIDDTQSQDFEVYVPEGKTSVRIPVTLKYRVDKKDYIEDTDLSINLVTKEEAKKLGLIKVSYTPYVILAVALIILAFLIIRRFRKKR